MTLALALAEIRDLVEGLTVASGPSYRLARTSDDVEGRFAERRFTLEITQRVGPLQTGLEPLVEYEAVLALMLVTGVDDFADQQRLAEEARDIARVLETTPTTPPTDVLVRGTTYDIEGGTRIAEIFLRVITRET